MKFVWIKHLQLLGSIILLLSSCQMEKSEDYVPPAGFAAYIFKIDKNPSEREKSLIESHLGSLPGVYHSKKHKVALSGTAYEVIYVVELTDIQTLKQLEKESAFVIDSLAKQIDFVAYINVGEKSVRIK